MNGYLFHTPTIYDKTSLFVSICIIFSIFFRIPFQPAIELHLPL